MDDEADVRAESPENSAWHPHRDVGGDVLVAGHFALERWRFQSVLPSVPKK
jgi:hypothetical protein